MDNKYIVVKNNVFKNLIVIEDEGFKAHYLDNGLADELILASEVADVNGKKPDIGWAYLGNKVFAEPAPEV